MGEKRNEICRNSTSQNHFQYRSPKITSPTSKSVEYFMDIIFPYLEKVKEEICIPKEQYSLVIMDIFKGQDNDILKELREENFCEVVIVLHNLTNKSQPLDISVNKSAKALFLASTTVGFQNKYLPN